MPNNPQFLAQLSKIKCKRAYEFRRQMGLRMQLAFLRLLAISGIVALVLPASAVPTTEIERGKYLV
jgi:hypothetical protein